MAEPLRVPPGLRAARVGDYQPMFGVGKPNRNTLLKLNVF